jgi:hypothetical protein
VAGIKLAKLPDRTPVKVALNLSPDLHGLLTDYAGHYERVYGECVPIADLVPAMLESFLDSDRDFIRSRREARAREGGAGSS